MHGEGRGVQKTATDGSDRAGSLGMEETGRDPTWGLYLPGLLKFPPIQISPTSISQVGKQSQRD